MEIIQPKDIVLPVELASGKYSLKEIGSIFVLMSIPHLDTLSKEKWNEDEDLMDILDTLITEGIATTVEIDGNLNLVMNI